MRAQRRRHRCAAVARPNDDWRSELARQPATAASHRVRHTIGMLDDRGRWRGRPRRPAGGEHSARAYFKIKLGGDPDAMLRGCRVGVCSTRCRDYGDARRQRAIRRSRGALRDWSLGRPRRALQASRPSAALHRAADPRELTRAAAAAARSPPRFMIDEADEHSTPSRAPPSSASAACLQGLQGPLQVARQPRARAAETSARRRRFFMSAEDLTCQAGLAVQQDLALVACSASHMPSATAIITSTASATRRPPKRRRSRPRIPTSTRPRAAGSACASATAISLTGRCRTGLCRRRASRLVALSAAGATAT